MGQWRLMRVCDHSCAHVYIQGLAHWLRVSTMFLTRENSYAPDRIQPQSFGSSIRCSTNWATPSHPVIEFFKFFKDFSPHCDLALEDTNPTFLHGTLGHDDALSYQVWLHTVLVVWKTSSKQRYDRWTHRLQYTPPPFVAEGIKRRSVLPKP